jgi:hypothetical protein
MEYGRLIRVRKPDAPVFDAIAYVVAIPDAREAIDLVRRDATDPDIEIEDMGRVSEALLRAMKLQPGQYMRADQYQKRDQD